jgi:hypothetical protein
MKEGDQLGVRIRRRVVLGLWTAVGLLLVLVLVGAARGDDNKPGRRSDRCTHGASSIGPVEIANGMIVGGSTTPHTEACLQTRAAAGTTH